MAMHDDNPRGPAWRDCDLTDRDGEEWRDVDGYVGAYMVSSHGRVKSCERTVRRRDRWGGVVDQFVPARVLKQSPRGRGAYLAVSFSGKAASVHSLVCVAFRGDRPPGMQAAHGNGNPTDNRACNLRWATAAENAADREAHGRTARGAAGGNASLSLADVESILRRLADGESQASIARRYGVTRPAVGYIYRGATWCHVPRPEGMPPVDRGYFKRSRSRTNAKKAEA